MDAIAKAKFLRGSPQKARLVIDMIRGKNVAQALAILQFTNKRATDNIEKCLRSAIANATFKAEQDNIAIDPDDLWVKTCFVDMGPHKHRRRVRPAPQGRAYREQRYYCHVTIEVTSEKPAKVKEAEAKRAALKAKLAGKKAKKETVAPVVTEEAKTARIVEETPVETVEQETVSAAPQTEETQEATATDTQQTATAETSATETAEAAPALEETETAANEETPAANETESTSEEKKTE